MNPNAASLQGLLGRLERFYGLLPQPPHDAFALYVWEVLSVYSTPPRREAAMTALRRIPALTPESVARAPRGKLEGAVRPAGPYLEERMRALLAGADVFRRHPRLGDQLRLPLAEATQAIGLLPHLSTASGQWMLLFAGDHPVVPADPRLIRVALRLGYGERSDDTGLAVASAQKAVAEALGDGLGVWQQAALYLTHHGLTTCLESDPHCHVCPLRDACPFPASRSAHSEGAGP
jgi:endonuclease III